MSDLVERLRLWGTQTNMQLRDDLREAAAEIERLTAALASAHNWLFCAAEEVGGSHLVATHGENPEGLARGIMEQYAAVEAALASEREACATLAIGWAVTQTEMLEAHGVPHADEHAGVVAAYGIASAIRARGKEI